MADEKDKKEGEEAEVKKKKKGLPAIVLVAVGAAIGGAGVVFFMKPPEANHATHATTHKLPKLPFKHPKDEGIQHSFNLKTNRGKSIAKVHFTFIYEAEIKEDDPHHPPDPKHPADPEPNAAALESLRSHWDEMLSGTLKVLMHATKEDLLDDQHEIEGRLRDVLNRTLFPGEEATVTKIVWETILIQ